jgi:hypothetical protein
VAHGKRAFPFVVVGYKDEGGRKAKGGALDASVKVQKRFLAVEYADELAKVKAAVARAGMLQD